MANVVGRGGKVDMMAVIGNWVRSRPMGNAVCFTYMQTALLLGTIGVASVVAAPKIMAQTATPADSAKAQTTALLAENKSEVKPISFATKTFNLGDGEERLTLQVVNTNGDASGFNAIVGEIYDLRTDKTKGGLLTYFVDKPDEFKQYFFLNDVNTTKVIATVGDEEAFAWVRKYVTNLTRNKSNIVVETAEKSTVN
jgi:hypothetical protein